MASLRSLAAAALLGHIVYALSPPVKRAVPALAQVIDQKSFNVLPTVPPAIDYNASGVSEHTNSNAISFSLTALRRARGPLQTRRRRR